MFHLTLDRMKKIKNEYITNKIVSFANCYKKNIVRLFCLSVVFLSGCQMAPTQNFFGSFFPAWMYCIIFGIFATIISRSILVHLKIDQYLKPRIVVYFAMSLCYIFLAWLVIFTDSLTAIF